MEIVFLGTGGGRINLVKQVRATGGIRVNSASANIHIDPGPGALVHSVRNKQDPLALDCIIVTHNHTDHVSDAQVLVEGMTGYCLKKKGIFIGTPNVFDENSVSKWHQEKIETIYMAEYGKKKTFKARGEFSIEIIKLEHEQEPNFGFRLEMDGITLGYISDTEYRERLGPDFSGCDCLIVSCIKPEADKYGGHLSSNDVIKVLKGAKPKQAIITHLGMKMMRVGPAKEAQRIEDASGVKTAAAKDGMRITL